MQATFDSYARYYYDSFRLTGMSVEAEVDAGFTVDGIEHIEAAMAEDDVGPVLALPHLGGWEWAAFWITQVRHWGLAAVVEQARTAGAVRMVPRVPDVARHEHHPAQPDRGRRGGDGRGEQGDRVSPVRPRPHRHAGPEVTFFGETTTLPAGPAVMALRGGCRVLPTAVYFAEHGVHGVVRPPIEIEAHPGCDVDPRGRRAIHPGARDRARGADPRAPEQWHLLQPNWPSDYEALGIAPPLRRG